MVHAAFTPLAALLDAQVSFPQGGSINEQIVLRWLLQQDRVIALSRSVKPERIAGNRAVFDFALSEADMLAIYGLADTGSRIVSPPGLAPIWDPTPAIRAPSPRVAAR